jgi:hypothetical protein
MKSDEARFSKKNFFVTIFIIFDQFYPKFLVFSTFLDFHSLDFADIAYYGR